MTKEQNKARKRSRAHFEADGNENRRKPPISKHRRHRRLVIPGYLKIVLAGLGIALLLTAGGFTFAATQEQRDSFCGSCHTQPESTYLQRSADAQPVDLASVHTPKGVRCIDCHSGIGVAGRVSAELLGAHNALAFYTGTAVQPARLTQPVGDDRCVKCHAAVFTKATMDNHFHYLLPKWQAADPTGAAKCVSCHSSHTTDGTSDNMYLSVPGTQAICEACHQVMQGDEKGTEQDD